MFRGVLLGVCLFWAHIGLSQTLKSQEKEDLVGTYAHYDIVSYIGDFLGPVKLKSRIISFGITKFYMKQEKLMTQDRFCFSEYKANLPFQSITDDEFTQAIIPEDVEMEVLKTNGELIVHRPETPTLLGVELNDYTEDFPADADDPRFIDADRDGNPGVTVQLKFGKFLDEQLYIARKEIFSYDIKVLENGVLAGVVRDRSQQYIIGASREDLVDQNNPIQNPDLSLSPIYLAPIKSNLNCAQLKKNRNLFFPKKVGKHKKFYRKYKVRGLDST